MPADDLVAERRRKVDELAALGLPAYNVDFRPDGTLAETAALLASLEAGAAARGDTFEEGPVRAVAGRVAALRRQGRSAFLHLEDEDGRLQCWLRADRLPERDWAAAALLDLGDIVGISGPLFRTRRGESTVLADSVTVLVKSLRPLPEKWHGLSDTETRYRKRHLDLVASEERRRHFRTRSAVIGALRRTLDRDGYLEVETPILQAIPGGGHARPFVTHWNALDTDVYLRIAIELYLKRLLVGGYRRVYEIGRVFRNEGLSPRHNPEFTMLECYEAFGDLSTMQALTERLVGAAASAAGAPGPDAEPGGSPPCGEPLGRTFQGRPLDLTPPFAARSMASLIEERAGFEPVTAWEDGSLTERARAAGARIPDGMAGGAVFFEIYDQLVESTIWEPTFVVDYPADVSPLARRSARDPRFVDRFELVVAGREIANAFSELNDPIDQRARFEAQAALRAAGDEEAFRLDEDFLEAIETGMPPAGGLGVGVDRLVMLLTDTAAIRDVLLFPTMRPLRTGREVKP
ncbi:MAG TPA: lysine--tRNA ligase [Candidatus Dormibacteraeota bacterium]|nr:lysine--tRNA ligase [Candidatus Dormibacteraeota bacterium]